MNFRATDTEFLTKEVFEYAKIQQWQFFEQYSHEPFTAVPRYIAKYLGLHKEREAEYFSKQEDGHKALQVMEQQLQQTPCLVGNRPTTADICLFGYTHVAEEGGFGLGKYQAIIEWIDRIQLLPNYIGME